VLHLIPAFVHPGPDDAPPSCIGYQQSNRGIRRMSIDKDRHQATGNRMEIKEWPRSSNLAPRAYFWWG
jgi:hypothetical protein